MGSFQNNRSRSHTPAALCDINVTPMVDVMLVLLIIFMVAAPLLTQGVRIQLPQAAAKTFDDSEDFLTLTLRADHTLVLNTLEIPHAKLPDVLRNNPRLLQNPTLYLRADRTLPYGFVVDIMNTAKESGVANLNIVTEPPSP